MKNFDKDIRVRVHDQDKGHLEDIAFAKGFKLSNYLRTIFKEKIDEWLQQNKEK
jgi:hypothetical protein